MQLFLLLYTNSKNPQLKLKNSIYNNNEMNNNYYYYNSVY